MTDEFTERWIALGLIVSDEYARAVRGAKVAERMESPELRRLAGWAVDYREKYDRVPGPNILDVFRRESRGDRLGDEGELIGEILDGLSDELDRGDRFNDGYLLDQTKEWLRERGIRTLARRVEELLADGRAEEAERLQASFSPASLGDSRGVELGDDESLDAVRKAFSPARRRLLEYPGALGRMLNPVLVRGGFVALLGPEKRGKSFWLLDLGLRALRQRYNVAYFDAGDNTRGQVLRRICVHVSRRTDAEPEAYWRPVGDCVLNQLDVCRRADRNCDHGVIDMPEEEYQADRDKRETRRALVRLAKANRRYRPCDSHTCDERKGAVWLERRPRARRLTGRSAQRHLARFVEKSRRRFKLANYPSGTLTVPEIRSCLDEWQQDDFRPDVILVDYADLMTDDEADFRHRQDAVWKGLRGLSQERHALLVTATQSDSASYKSRRVSAHNFSEDKRKNAHVTAMVGLNQDPKGREKQLGLMRLNLVLVRDDRAQPNRDVTVLQDLRLARAFLESY